MPGQSGLTDVIFNTLYGQQHNLFRTVQQLLQQVVTTTTNEQEKIDAARLAFDLIQRVNDDEGGDLDEFRQGLQHELALRVMKLIGQDPSGQEALDHALELYALDSGVRLIVLELLMRALLQCVQDLVQNPDSIDVQESNLGTVIESVTHHCEAYMKLRAHGYPFALEYQHVEVGPALSFLAAAVTQMHPLPETLYWAYSGILMVSLRSKSNRLSGPACTALHALWSATPVVTLTESIEYQSSWNDRIHVPDWIATLLWRTLYVLTHTSRLTDRNTAGFALWLQALTNADQCLDRRILKRDRYWQVLRKGLSTGSNEQKKYALRILLVSVPMTSDDRDHETKIYTRYATLFETIVLSRYLNQVQDSLPDLSKASVAPIWIVTLLQAALSHGMQDSIRKVVGAWTLTKGLNVVAASGVAGTFVRDALLPWAALGYHCTSSVRQTPQGLVCDHGEGLSCFLAQLIAQSRDAPGLVRSSLEFLVLQDRHMFPFGRAYILDGLIRGIKCTALPLDEECLSLIVKIHMVQGFQSLVQDLMNAQCYELVMCASGNARDASNIHSLTNVRSELRDTKSDMHSMQDCAWTLLRNTDPGPYEALLAPTGSIRALSELLRDTKHRCLWSSGLEACQRYMRSVLERSSPSHLDSQYLAHIFEALWEEMEVQEYPRKALMVFPNLLLHRTCLDLCNSTSELGRLISRLTLALQKLSTTRIYLFSSLAESLRKAVLHGPGVEVLSLEQLLIDYANEPPSTRIEFQLELAVAPRLEAFEPSRTYSSYYGKQESYGHACIFDLLSRLPRDPLRTGQCRTVLDALIKQWVEQKQPVPVFSKWKKSTQLQGALLCLEHVLPSLDDDQVDAYSEKLLGILSFEPLPRFRYLLEWMIVRTLVYHPNRRIGMLTLQENMDISNPKYLVSIMKINLLSAMLPNTTEDFGLELMTQLIPLSASPKIVIRHEAQWTFAPLWDCAVERRWNSILDNPAFARLNKKIRALETYKHPPAARILERFHPVRDHNMTHLLQGNYLRIEPSEPARTGHADLLEMHKDDPRSSELSKDTLLPSGSPLENLVPVGRTDSESSAAPSAASANDERASAPLQTKAAQQIDLRSLLPALPDQSERRIVRPVIVIASFIDNPFNLGSLSRLSEISGVQSLQISDKRVLENKDFKSVSVASHLWLPIGELKSDAVSAYLHARKKEGYTVVGIEQTDSSCVLGTQDCKLSEKIVLVLGSEREGIPAQILADLDSAVEIQQMGVTRSMNVQTAAACVLYEYSRQRRLA